MLIKYLKIFLQKKYWRMKNKHNFTKVGKNCSTSKISVGIGTYGVINMYNFNNVDEFLKIGNYCSIAPNVYFILGGEHDYKSFSTYPYSIKFLNKGLSTTKGPIVIEDDVWIGYGATILSGVHIGQGAIIGAGTVVAKDVPPYAIFVNGKIIKYRFSQDIIKKLLTIDFSKIDLDKIKKYNALFNEDITNKNIDLLLEKINERGD